MINRLQKLSAISFMVLAFIAISSQSKVLADQSITDAAPTAIPTISATPVATSTPTPEATPGALPQTGTSPLILGVLVLALFISVGIYFFTPSEQK